MIELMSLEIFQNLCNLAWNIGTAKNSRYETQINSNKKNAEIRSVTQVFKMQSFLSSR